ncbi:MAG: SDR family NAD(P)-dependent oxidoreductase [Gemmatimonadales bacterium]|nr:SDR family NAD(P)-dependent oxidoreductase [Gemmatimonadales bacterium]
MRLKGEHALVTGANRGIGAAIARALAAEGADVSLLVRDAAGAEPVAAELRATGVRAGIVTADVTDRAALLRACAAAAEARGPVTLLVNNAGTVQTVPFLKVDDAEFARMYAVHLMAPVHAAQAVLPAMLERGGGAIVNVASIAGLVGAPYVAAYVAAKHAMVGLTRALAVEFQAKGIRVNAVCPGYTDTALVSDAMTRIVKKTGRSEAEAMALILADAGQTRLVTPEEVAEAVVRLCDPTSSANGTALPLLGAEAGAGPAARGGGERP